MSQNQIQSYADSFAAQTVQADPPTWVEPTDHHIARVLGVELQYDECSDIRHTFLRPVWHDTLTATARPTHAGRTITHYACDIVRADGKVAATVTSAVMTLRGEAARGR